MRLKKFMCCLLALTLLVGLAPGVLAAGTPTVSISSGEVKAGESVTLTVSIKDNPGLAAALIYIYYDTSVFEFDPSEDVRAVGVFGSSGGVIGNTIAEARKNGRYSGDAGKDGALALWYNGSGIDTDGDGEMLRIMLKARTGVASGNYTIGLGYSAMDTRNTEGTVKLNTVSGTVTVTGGTSGGETPPSSESPETPDAPVTPAPGGEEITPKFLDVDGHWAEDYIEDAAQLGLIVGYEGLYRPNDTMTRAELVTILWRASGEPQPAGKTSFTDLESWQTWYHDAVTWAEENNVVNGVGDGKFDPNGSVTREQLATILFRLSGGKSGMETMLGGVYDDTYTDSGKISDWARKGLYWSIYNVVFCGVDSVSVGTELSPREAADRAQIAVMIVRYLDRE